MLDDENIIKELEEHLLDQMKFNIEDAKLPFEELCIASAALYIHAFSRKHKSFTTPFFVNAILENIQNGAPDIQKIIEDTFVAHEVFHTQKFGTSSTPHFTINREVN